MGTHRRQTPLSTSSNHNSNTVRATTSTPSRSSSTTGGSRSSKRKRDDTPSTPSSPRNMTTTTTTSNNSGSGWSSLLRRMSSRGNEQKLEEGGDGDDDDDIGITVDAGVGPLQAIFMLHQAAVARRYNHGGMSSESKRSEVWLHGDDDDTINAATTSVPVPPEAGSVFDIASLCSPSSSSSTRSSTPNDRRTVLRARRTLTTVLPSNGGNNDPSSLSLSSSDEPTRYEGSSIQTLVRSNIYDKHVCITHYLLTFAYTVTSYNEVGVMSRYWRVSSI
jgi:hypothetical protein